MEQDLSVQLSTRDWERLLSVEQKEKYKGCIRQGYFSDYHGAEWRHATFTGAYLWKYPRYINVVRIFEKLVGHRPTWDDVTDDNLRDLFEELESQYAPNTTHMLCATIKALIRENDATRHIKSGKFASILKRKVETTQFVYLTDEEIDRVVKYVPHGLRENYVHRIFIIECLAGARISDCMRITSENIDETGRFLVYVTQKTKTEVRVPIHRRLRQFLVNGGPKTKVDMSYLMRGQFNAIIRDICRKVGINKRVKIVGAGKEQYGEKWQFVSSHTGRRSFATNLSKKGVALEQIALMMGHMSRNTPNVMMTKGYICGKMELSQDVLKLFGIYDVPSQAPAVVEKRASKRNVRYNVYYNDGSGSLACVASAETLAEAQKFVGEKITSRPMVDDDSLNHDEYNADHVARFDIYHGEPSDIDFNGDECDQQPPVYSSGYFYVD